MKKVKQLFLILVLTFSVLDLNAQLDSNYIENYKNNISIGIKAGVLNNNFVIRNKDHRYNLNSNIVPTTSIWFKYKKLPAIAIAIPLSSLNSDTLAKTQGIAVELKGQIAKGFIVDGYFFFERGFNFQNRDNLNEIRPMPKSFNINASLELFYIFNFKKFSYKSVYLFGENQKKSSGSFATGYAIGFFRLNNSKSFFKEIDGTEANIDLRDITTLNIGLNFGYMHNFVFGRDKRWLINVSAFIGPNFNLGTTKFFHYAEDYKVRRFGLTNKYKVGIVHNLKKWIFSISSTGDFISYRPTVGSFMNSNIIGVQLSSIYKF